MKLGQFALALTLAGVGLGKPVHLRCAYMTNPLGIDIAQPSLSWQSDNAKKNWRQSAYEVFVASKPELLKNPDVWDSGRQSSGESVGIAYAGPKLESARRYYWTVRVWDAKGRAESAAEPAWWETGLLRREDWKAQWIRWQNREEAADMQGMRWIWAPGEDALHVPIGTERHFLLHFRLDTLPERAALFLVARGDWTVRVNGRADGNKPHWNEFDRRDLMSFLRIGENAIEVNVKVPPPETFGPNAHAKEMPGGLAALVKIWNADGTVQRIPTNSGWQVTTNDETRPAAAVGELSDVRFGTSPGQLPQPAALLRHSFVSVKEVSSARLYATALGAYSMYINGERVGPYVLTPGFTQFDKRVQYQTYDVTGLLKNGANVAAAVLGAGWFGSGISWTAEHFKVLPPTRFLAQIEISYRDGSHSTVVTDPSWKAGGSPILFDEIYAGETYDARLEQAGWSDTSFDDANWARAVAADPYDGELSAQIDLPPQVAMTLKPERMSARPDGSYVFDMGQNLVGWAVLNVSGRRGETVQLRFAEILNPDGSIYTTNLRNADATDVYTLRGGAPEQFSPAFTFHGFRYIEVKGYPGKPTLQDLTVQVISSVNSEPTAKITTSSDLVNRMWKLGIWGQRSNFLSIPTDCPQRDERLGWMADAAVFWRTGSYNFNISAFTNKWMRDVTDAQLPNGAFTNVSPNIGVGSIEGAPGWGDAGIIVPWTGWTQYGDTSVVKQNWEAMRRWMQFIQAANPDYIRKNKVGPDFADWLAPDPRTPKDLVDTAYWSMIANMMTQMAHAVGDESAANEYTELHSRIREAFRSAYIRADGSVATGTQTSYVLALHMDLVPSALRSAAAGKLVEDIRSHGDHLTTGFLGTPFLLKVLADNGHLDMAYKLLLTTTYPSWGYMIAKGATTWWERWNGDTGDPAMNSYNHYAFGSVMAWVYQAVAGIDTSASGKGFHEIVIRPRPDSAMSSVQAEYASVYGNIKTDWTVSKGGRFVLRCTIPANTTARVFLPEGISAKNAVRDRDGMQYVTVGAGVYNFHWRIAASYFGKAKKPGAPA